MSFMFSSTHHSQSNFGELIYCGLPELRAYHGERLLAKRNIGVALSELKPLFNSAMKIKVSNLSSGLVNQVKLSANQYEALGNLANRSAISLADAWPEYVPTILQSADRAKEIVSLAHQIDESDTKELSTLVKKFWIDIRSLSLLAALEEQKLDIKERNYDSFLAEKNLCKISESVEAARTCWADSHGVERFKISAIETISKKA